jgi:tetratricopeptide (TPR) repeat protein
MSLQTMIGWIGLLYILVFSGISILRREQVSIRFVVESICITAATYVLVAYTPLQIHSAIFLLVLYGLTLRSRLLVDLANYFARSGKNKQADKVYQTASHLWPDETSRMIINVNRAIFYVQVNKLDESVALFTQLLNPTDKKNLSARYEAAVHYNLGVAYLRQDNHSLAEIEFNTVIETWPTSPYAERSQQALDRMFNNAKVSMDDLSTHR